MNKFLLTIASLFFIAAVFGQNTDKIAHAGAKRIFIGNIYPPTSNKTILNRREAGKTDWQKIGEFAIPLSSMELLDNYRQYSSYAFDPSFLNTEQLSECWQTLDRTHNWDSLRSYLYDPVMMLAIGRLYVDTTALKGVSYEYQIAKLNDSGVATESLILTPIKLPGSANYQKPRLKSKNITQQAIRLEYYTLHDRKPAYFRVMRRVGALGQWEETYPQRFINKKTQNADTILFTLNDENINPDQQYQYYIATQDGYGNYSPNLSDTIAVLSYALKDVMLPQYFNSESIDKEAALLLHWRVMNPQYIAGIELFRSNDYEEGYKQIATLSPSDTSFVDYGIAPLTAYYYYMKIVDKQRQQTIRSVKVYGLMLDAHLPGPPSQVTAEAGPSGVLLKWVTNGHFINGFYVYRSLGVDGKLEQISALIPHKDSLVSYIDTSKLKPGYQYTYCITQESTSHIAGKYSKPVYVTALSSRDPLPIAIQFTAQRDGKRAQLFWEDLRLQNKTILSYQLFRKSAADVGFVKLALISSHAHSYMDSTLQQGNEYLYGLSCIDAGGTMGTMAQSNTITYPSPEMPSVQGIRAFTEASATRLTWDKPLETTSVNKYNVYRYERDGAPVLLGSVTGAESQYIDNTAAKSTFYFYYITCVAYDGNEGLASIPVGIAH